MAKILAPTKGNLMSAKNTLRMSRRGYEMMDKKRNILIREMMELIEEAKSVEAQLETVFSEAYAALEAANIMSGMDKVEDLAHTTVIDDSVKVNLKSIMGAEIPVLSIKNQPLRPVYSFFSSNSALDEALLNFTRVKQLTVRLAEIENSVYRLAMSIKKTQKRANALKNITIPFYEQTVKNIQNILEEKEREEYGRLKLIKKE